MDKNINNNNNNRKYNKNNSKNLNNIKEKNEEIEIEYEKEKEYNENDYQTDMIFNDALHEYFYKDEFLKVDMADDKDIKKIQKVYKNLLKNNNIDIEIIKEIQNDYIETDVKQTMNIIKNKKNLEIINSRIKALEQLVDNINN